MEIRSVDNNGYTSETVAQKMSEGLFRTVGMAHPMTVGLTGGMGCGKTTVLREFQRIGVPCFVADEVAASYYQEPAFLQEIRSLFGSAVLLPDGTADKRAIADIVFHDKDKLLQLNALVHPRVMRDFASWTERQTAAYVLMESAVLFEYGLNRAMHKVVSVYLDPEERLRRLAQRDHVGREALEARMHNQWSAEEKMDKANYVILNYEGNPRCRQVSYIHDMLLQDAVKYHTR